jgi:hypothetical protein
MFAGFVINPLEVLLVMGLLGVLMVALPAAVVGIPCWID